MEAAECKTSCGWKGSRSPSRALRSRRSSTARCWAWKLTEVAYHWEPAFALIKVGGEIGGTIGPLSVEEARKEGAQDMTATQKRAAPVRVTRLASWPAASSRPQRRSAAFGQPAAAAYPAADDLLADQPRVALGCEAVRRRVERAGGDTRQAVDEICSWPASAWSSCACERR